LKRSSYGSPRSLDESVPEFRPRRKTLLETAEHPIPVSGNDVVSAIQQRGWQDARTDCRLSRPTKLASNEEHCLALSKDLAVTRPVVWQNVK